MHRTILALAEDERGKRSYGRVVARTTDAALRGYIKGLNAASQFIVSLSIGQVRGAIEMTLEEDPELCGTVFSALEMGVSLRTIEMNDTVREPIAAIATIVRDAYVKLFDDARAEEVIYDMKNVERALLQPPRIAVIADREIENIQSLAEAAAHDQPTLDIAGIFVPGFELDGEILRVLDFMVDVRKDGVGIPIERPDLEHGEDRQIEAPYRHIRYAHVPYDAKKLKSDLAYREEYCARLKDEVKATMPDWVVLYNFKLVLHKVMTAEFSGRMVNIHPSFLPLNKGYRTEKMADPHIGNKNPEALGYTMHMVSDDLDGGPTLFQQQVEADPFDEEDVKAFGSRELYNQYREETLRLKIIKAESKYSAKVMGIVASKTLRKTVDDAEAFAAEGRAGFENNPAYLESLQLDFDHYKKSHQDEQDITYEKWFTTKRKPYQRVLFEKDGTYQTLEEILGAKKVAVEQTHAPLTRYNFTLRGSDPHLLHAKYAGQILSSVEGSGKLHHEMAFVSEDEDGTPCLVCTIFGTKDLGPILGSLGVDYKARVMAVGVTAQRKSPYE